MTNGRVTGLSVQGAGLVYSASKAGDRTLTSTHANGVVMAAGFDPLRRAVSVDWQSGATSVRKYTYAFDLAGKRLYEKRHHAAGSGDLYAHDSLGRIVSVLEGLADPAAELAQPGSQTYAQQTQLALDGAQNRTTRTVTPYGGAALNTVYTMDARNFYVTVGGAAQLRDPNGNLIDDGTFEYKYDYRDQLVRVVRKSTGTTVADYFYDAIGRRVEKVVGSAATNFYYLGVSLAEEHDSNGLVSRRHYADGNVVYATQRDFADLDADSSTTDFVGVVPLYNGTWDCTAIVGPGGNVVESLPPDL